MLGVQNHKIKAFPANANIYSFCKFEPKYKLEKTSKFKFNKGTIATHSTIADSQHRVVLTFLGISLICCFSTAHIVSQYVSLSSNKLLIQATL